MARQNCQEKLFQAIRDCKPLTVWTLLSNKSCDPNCRMNDEYCTTALILAVKYKKVQSDEDLQRKNDCMEILLNFGASINDGDKHGMTASMHAASMGLVKLLQTLIRFRADLRAMDNDGATAVMLATQLGKCECLQLLINNLCVSDQISDLNRADKSGRTALMHAAIHGQYECLRRLVDVRVDLNAVDQKEYSALMYALKKAEISCAKMLLNQKEININLVSSDGNETALSLAFQAIPRDYTVIEDLLKRGADVSISKSAQDYLHEMVTRNKKQIVRMMVVNGCPPLDKICSQECFQFFFPIYPISPITVALLSGYPDTARYFIAARFLTAYDLTRLCNDSEICQKIVQINNSAVVLPLLKHMRTMGSSRITAENVHTLDCSGQRNLNEKMRPLYQLCILYWHDAPLDKTICLEKCHCRECEETVGFKVVKK